MASSAPPLLTRLLSSPAAVHLLFDADPTKTRLTLDAAALCSLARGAAELLARYGVRAGDRVLLALPTSERFLAFFFGAWWLGAVPVPMPEPTALRRESAAVDRLRGVLADAQPRVLVVAAGTRKPPAPLGPVRMLAEPVVPRAEGPPMAPEEPDSVAFVQYTAGSTGAPKGVVVLRRNVSANVEAIGEAVEVRETDRVLSWLPLYHDMGLVGTLLFPLFHRLEAFLYSPLGFVTRPAGWLEAIDAHRATLSPAPHFAYGLVAYKLPDSELAGLDLSCWRLALDGSEPIRAETVRRFLDRLRPHGLSPRAYCPVYGLSEVTLAATFPRLGEGLVTETVERTVLARERRAARADEGLELVSVGRAVPGHEVRIERDGEVVGEGVTGEVVVSGPSVAPGYLGRRSARLAGGTLRTGDVGFLDGGRLYLVDRLKDVIIRGGANLFPTDLERALADVPGVRRGRVLVFAVRAGEPETEEVVVAVESREAGRRRTRVAEEVAKRAAAYWGFRPLTVEVLAPGSLPLTANGKLMRHRARALFEAGTLGKTSLLEKVARRVAVRQLERRRAPASPSRHPR